MITAQKTLQNNKLSNKFLTGAKLGLPIMLGYIPVSFTFGLIGRAAGLPALIIILISITNFTSAGQFAGANLICVGASITEISVTTFIINLRYMLMSLSISQRIDSKLSMKIRSILAFGITDETFTTACIQDDKILSPHLILGLQWIPYIGWVGGTIMGVFLSGFFPEPLRNAMGITLYAMFIALVIPAAKKSKSVFIVSIIAIAITSMLTWIPVFNFISAGWRIIIATIIAASFGAILYPKDVNEQ